MDTFFEQITSIRKSGKDIACVLALWFGALFLSVVAFLFLGSLGPIAIAGIIYGAFKLSGKFNVEYEYIITNGTMDVDKITNKSSRKRILSFELTGVTRLEKYNQHSLNSINAKEVVFTSNLNDENSYLMVAEKEGKKPYYLVFSPNEKIKTAIAKYIPKYISNSAFK